MLQHCTHTQVMGFFCSKCHPIFRRGRERERERENPIVIQADHIEKQKGDFYVLEV